MRECGNCRLCCYIFQLEGDFWGGVKPKRTWCRYAKGKGCAMHDQPRPEVCTRFKCLWLDDEEMPENWRPDKSGILLAMLGGVETSDGRDIPVIEVSEHYAGLLDKSQFARSHVGNNAILLVNYAHERGTRLRNLPRDRDGNMDQYVLDQIAKEMAKNIDPTADPEDFEFRQVG